MTNNDTFYEGLVRVLQEGLDANERRTRTIFKEHDLYNPYDRCWRRGI